MLNQIIFETERLKLRHLTPDIYRHLFKHYDEDFIMNYLGLDSMETFEREKARNYPNYPSYDRTFEIFQIILKETGNVLGMTGFVRWNTDHKRGELGYALFKEEHYGQGFMTEACRPVVLYGFEKLNIHRMEAFVGPSNAASKNIVKKLGFEFEARLKDHFCNKGVMEDSELWVQFNPTN